MKATSVVLPTSRASGGARLRDLPSQEFPQLPERVAHSLQQLWNEALGSAHEALRTTLLEREHAAAARAVALEDSLALAREQLAVANQRAQALENSVQERDGRRSLTRADRPARGLSGRGPHEIRGHCRSPPSGARPVAGATRGCREPLAAQGRSRPPTHQKRPPRSINTRSRKSGAASRRCSRSMIGCGKICCKPERSARPRWRCGSSSRSGSVP